jgi:hypothetical protein
LQPRCAPPNRERKPTIGFEPITYRLRSDCSTVELRRPAARASAAPLEALFEPALMARLPASREY